MISSVRTVAPLAVGLDVAHKVVTDISSDQLGLEAEILLPALFGRPSPAQSQEDRA